MSNAKLRQGDCSSLWPMLLDYSRHECLQLLRRFELEAYSNVVNVFRAQGILTNEKRKLLHKLQRFLNISGDRHKAEVRRALNDEQLATISEALSGKAVSDEWIFEAKRIAPVFHRPSANTIFLADATKESLEQLLQNNGLPPPCATAKSTECTKMYQRIVPISFSKKDELPKVRTADKATETQPEICTVPSNIVETEMPRRVGVTCGGDTEMLNNALLNGHSQTVEKTSFDTGDKITNKLSPTFEDNPEGVSFPPVAQSAQGHEQSMIKTSTLKHQDVNNLVNSVGLTVHRKRSTSTTTVSSGMNPPASLTLVHNSQTAPATSRPSMPTPLGQLGTHLDSMVTLTGRNQRMTGHTVSSASRSLTFVQPSTDRSIVIPPLSSSHLEQQTVRPQSQILVHVSRTPSEATAASVPNTTIPIIQPSGQSASVFVSPAPMTPGSAATIRQTSSSSVSGLKTAAVFTARLPSQSRSFGRPLTNPSELRLHPGLVPPTIATVSSNLQPSRGMTSVVVSLAEQPRPVPVSHYSPKITSGHLISESARTSASSASSLGPTPPVKRLVYPSMPLVSPSNQTGLNSNLVVFQRGISRKLSTAPIPPVKLATVSSQSVPPTAGPSSTRSIRIVNIPTDVSDFTSATPPVSSAGSECVDPNSTTITDTFAPGLNDISIPALLNRASHLRASINVDLDADEIRAADNVEVPSGACIRNDATEVQSDDSSSKDPGALSELATSYHKDTHLRAILGLSSQASLSGPQEPISQDNLPTSGLRRQAHFSENDENYDQPAKRICLSPQYSPSQHHGFSNQVAISPGGHTESTGDMND